MAVKGNISAYKNVDPDGLYYHFPDGSQTFFFIPKQDVLYMQPYPTNHQEMLSENKELFQMVYSKFLQKNTLDGRLRNALTSRQQALIHGEAALGRIALDGMTPLIAFWKSETTPVTPKLVRNFLKALYKKLPAFKNFESSTVLLIPGQIPITVSDFTKSKSESPARELTLKPLVKKSSKKFIINGGVYTLGDLQNMRADVHTRGYTDPILCHPDLDKYPELIGYKPASCRKIDMSLRTTHPQNWRKIGRNNNLPYLYTPENDSNFKSWFLLREIFNFTN